MVSPAMRAAMIARACAIDPPLASGETGELVALICPTGQEEYCLKMGLTGF